jgi:CheY-like chemotaxis protein
VDLVCLTRDAAEDARSVLEQSGLTLSLELPTEPIWVMGDATRLSQVLGNLLNNAAKFTDAGGQVTVGCRASGVGGRDTGATGGPSAASDNRPSTPMVEIIVRDTGIGIEPETLPHVFETFSQADRSLDRSRGGLGLGLALVKGLVELHGGAVHAQSRGLGLGAEFTVALPTIPAPPEALELPPVADAAGAIRILIVEDNRDAAETLRELLELYGCTVEVAFSGSSGLDVARRFCPEVVLCDLGLPGLDGYAVAAALREEPGTAGARLIAISGYGQEEDKRRCREAGFDLHLTKPVDPTELQRYLEVSPQPREV